MKIKELTELMKQKNLDSLLIAGGNPHMIEFVPEIWQYREYISDFYSSFGNVVVTAKGDLFIATDGRYELAVKKHAKKHNVSYAMKADRTNFEEELNWLKTLNYDIKNIGIIPETISLTQYTLLVEKTESLGLNLELTENLVTKIWDIKTPKIKEIFSIQDYDDVSVDAGLQAVRNVLEKNNAELTVITNLEAIAIITKTRGYDIPNTPLFISYLIITKEKAVLFVDKNKVPKGYKIDGIEIDDYSNFESELKNFCEGKIVIVEPYETTYFLYNLLEKTAKEIIFDNGEMKKQKGFKTAYQLANTQQSAVKDGVALTNLFYYIDQNINNNITEKDVLNKLYNLKQELFDDFIMESFPSIVGYMANGAVVHYKTGNTVLKPEGIVLVDSGSQYYTGTTDVTRTVALGKVSDEIKIMYTMVLKGHLEIARLVFTEGTSGKTMDLLARKHLFSIGADYKHGTGHGVGYISNVHETSGVGISSLADVPIYVGMTFSNEPGYYKEDGYGIRIENIVGVIPSKFNNTDTYTGENFAELMQLTMYPYDLALIDTKLLTKDEIVYINKYHNEVFEKVSPYLDEDTKSWFKGKCANINL